MDHAPYILGVDIGGTHIRIGLVDDRATVLHAVKIEQRRVFSEDPIRNLIHFIQSYLQTKAAHKTISALAMGLPATMNRERSIIYNAPNIEGFNGLNIKAVLQDAFAFPVFLERDVAMLFYYDLYDYDLPHTGVMIGCYVGTGLGSIISIDGSLLTGQDGMAGELGHIPIMDRTEQCACGNPGCAELYTAGKCLDEMRTRVYPDVRMNQLFAEKGEEPLLRKFVERLAIPIATEINILNPGTVILGGGVLSMKGFPKERLEAHIHMHARKPIIGGRINLLYSRGSGDENGIIGCAMFAQKKLKI